VGLAPAPLARPLGKLALGPLCSGQWSQRRLGHSAVLSLYILARGLPCVGLGLSIATEMHSEPPLAHDPKRRHATKTATDRAVEAIESAEKIFAEEMGATLDLGPAAKMALIATITAAIQAAVAEEGQQLTWVL